MAVEGGTASHYFILVIRKFIDFFCRFSDIVRGFLCRVWNMQLIALAAYS